MSVQADLVTALTETLVALQGMQTKDRVRTPQGAAFYGQPIGSVIVRDKRSMYTGIFDRVKDAGATIRLTDLGEPTTGFVIAERGKNQEIPEEVFFDRARGKALLHEYVRKHAAELSQPDRALGLWHDVDNGEVVLDTVFVMGDREQAILAGQQNNQQAIYDVEAGDVIDTHGTGDRNALVPGADRKSSEAGERDDAGRGRRVAGQDPRRDGGGARSLKVRHVRTPRGVARFGQALGSLIEPDLPTPTGSHMRDGMHVRKPRPQFRDHLRAREFFFSVTPNGALDEDLARQYVASMDDDQVQRLITHLERMRYSSSGQHQFSHRYKTVTELLRLLTPQTKVRHVRTPKGQRRFKQPIGAAIVPNAQLELPDMPSHHPLTTRTDIERAKIPNAAEARRKARLQTEEAQRLLSAILQDEDMRYDLQEQQTLYDRFGLDAESDPYDSPSSGTVAGAIAGSQWGYFGACRQIRRAAYDLLGYEERRDTRSADHNLYGPTPQWGGGDEHMTGYLQYMYAYALMDELRKQDPLDFPLYRGVALNEGPDDYIAKLREGDSFDMPLGSFTDYRPSAERFTGPQAVAGAANVHYAPGVRDLDEVDLVTGESLTDFLSRRNVLFVLQKGARAIQGGEMGYSEDDYGREDWRNEGENCEYISGGRFKVMSVHHSEKKNQTLIYIKQEGVFDPDTGVLETKVLDMTGKPCPFDWVWDEPYIQRTPGEKKSLETKVRRVRTAAGVKYFGLPIGSVIGFTGTRNGMTKEQRDKVGQIVKGVRPKTVHHGDAIGADSDFHKIARRLKIRTHKHPSNLPDAVQGHNTADIASKPKPPLERNKDIVARSGAIIATPSSMTEERRSGTWATVRQARRTKTPLIIVFPDGTVKRENFKTTKAPTPVAAPTPVTVPNAPAPATQGGSLTYGKPHKNFPKGFERISTPSGEWYHVGNAGSAQKPNWRVYLHDDYSRRGIVSTRNKDRLDAIQWIRNKHRNDVVTASRAKPRRSPEDDAHYQHREKVSKALSKELTRIHEIPGNRPDTAEWHVVEDHVVTDSYQGYREVITAIKKAIRFHIRQGTNAKLTPNQRTHHRWLAHEVTKTRTLKRPRVKPGTGVLSPAGVFIPKAYEPEEYTEDYTEVEGTLYDLLKKLHGLHNTGPLKHKAPPLTEFNARKRAIDLIEVDDVLDSMSPLGRWAKSGKTTVKGEYTKQDVLRNIHSIVLRRKKAGYDTEEAEQLHDWMKKRIRPKVIEVPTQQVPRQHQWHQSRHPGHPAGEYIRDTPMYDVFGNEIWVSDVTYDDPKNPGRVVNLKFIKTKHPDGTYSIQYPGGHTETYKDQRTANAAANEWLKKNTPLVSMEGKSLIDSAVRDIILGIELKVRHVVDADYWGLPVGTPITEHLYRAHPRLRTAHMRVRNAPRRAAASKPDVLTKHPSKYEDYEHYKGPDGRDYYVGEADDGFWVATDGDNLDLWPATGSTKSEVLRDLRAYVGRQQQPTPAPASAPAPAKKTTHKPLKVTASKKPAKKAPAKKAPAKKPAKKAPAKRTAAPKPAPATQKAPKPSKPATGATAASPKKAAPKVKVPMLTITKKGSAEEVVRKETLRTKPDGTTTGQPRMVFTVKQQGKEWVALKGNVVTHRSPTRTGVMIAIERHGMIDAPTSRTARGWKLRGTTAKSIAAWRSKWGGGDPLIEGQYNTTTAYGKTKAGYHYATYEERRDLVGPARFNVWVRDAGWENASDRDDIPVTYSFDGQDVQRGYTAGHGVLASEDKQDRVQQIDEATTKLLDDYLHKNWRKDPVAACLLVMWRQGLRPSKENAVEGKGRTYGATVLQRRHVFLDEVQDHVILRFKGKTYKNVTLDVDDPDLVKMFKAYCKGPDLKNPDDAFIDPDLDPAGIKRSKSDMTPLFPGVTPALAQRRLRDITGNDTLKLKDLRTNKANIMAMKFKKTHAAPKTETEYKRLLNEVAALVAAELGNQASMARKSYIDMKRIFKSWQQPGWSDPQ